MSSPYLVDALRETFPGGDIVNIDYDRLVKATTSILKDRVASCDDGDTDEMLGELVTSGIHVLVFSELDIDNQSFIENRVADAMQLQQVCTELVKAMRTELRR